MSALPRLDDEDSQRLGLIELLDRDGGVAHRVPILRWPVTLGRSLDCDVVLDDPHAAAHHATLDAAGDGALLSVGDTINGVRLGGTLLAAGGRAALPGGSEWQIGRTRLRLRLAGEALAPEQALVAPKPVPRNLIRGGLLLLLLWLLGERWLQSDPGDPVSGYLPVLVGVPVALGVWCTLWALASKLFTRHFEYLPHLRIALTVLLAAMAIDTLLPLAAFALSWEWLARGGELATLALGCYLLHGHLSLIVPSRRQALAVGFATMFVVGVSMKLLLNYQRNDRFFASLYLSTLAPPALRLTPAVSPERFIEEARRLREPLEARARDRDSAPLLSDDED